MQNTSIIMYDSVNFRLKQDEAGEIDFLSEIPCYLDNVGEHHYSDEVVITGSLNGLNVTTNRYQVKVKDGSLCKWYLGDNFQTMGRNDTKRAIEKLSDTLHLPMDRATVTRLDVAHNLIVKEPVDIYLNHLGTLRYCRRCSMIESGSLYYSKAGNRLCFYDKVREQKGKGKSIPELYVGRNVLRYEQQYIKRVATQLGVPTVTGALLYDEAFYIALLNRWRDNYKEIRKINDISINFAAMKVKKDFDLAGRLCLIEMQGGELAMIESINEAYKCGTLSRRQADELKRATREACRERVNFTACNENISELDKKVNEAIKFYR